MSEPAKPTIAAILASILDIERVSPTDDFFRLGGDSLAATVLMSALEQIHGVVIDPVEIFERPTIGEFSAWFERTLAEMGQSTLTV